MLAAWPVHTQKIYQFRK